MDKDIKQLIERVEFAANCNSGFEDGEFFTEIAAALKSLTRQLTGVESKTLQPVGVEPVAWKDTARTSHEDVSIELDPVLLGYEGWESLPDGMDLYSEYAFANLQASNAQLQDERDMAHHLLDKVSANYDTLFERSAQLQAELDELELLCRRLHRPMQRV